MQRQTQPGQAETVWVERGDVVMATPWVLGVGFGTSNPIAMVALYLFALMQFIFKEKVFYLHKGRYKRLVSPRCEPVAPASGGVQRPLPAGGLP